MLKLSVIIVVYNEFESVMKCLDSLYKDSIRNSEIILVHNPSGQVGIKEVLKKYPNIKYIETQENIGFGSAANRGILKAKGEYVLVLTPDTLLLPHTIQPTIAYMDSHKKVGLAGCRVYSQNRQLNQSAFQEFPNLITHLYEYNIVFYKTMKKIFPKYFPTAYSLKDHLSVIDAKHIIGAYLLLRRSAVVKIGMFDKRYFLYREETDLCKRLYDNGWGIVYLPFGGIVHYGDSKGREIFTQCSPYYLKSTYLFFKKNCTNSYAYLAWLIGLLSACISVPFLLINIVTKSIQNKKSQSYPQLSCWLRIVQWHIVPGVSIVFFSK